jgi:hypothetical protein
MTYICSVTARAENIGNRVLSPYYDVDDGGGGGQTSIDILRFANVMPIISAGWLRDTRVLSWLASLAE